MKTTATPEIPVYNQANTKKKLNFLVWFLKIDCKTNIIFLI